MAHNNLLQTEVPWNSNLFADISYNSILLALFKQYTALTWSIIIDNKAYSSFAYIEAVFQ